MEKDTLWAMLKLDGKAKKKLELVWEKKDGRSGTLCYQKNKEGLIEKQENRSRTKEIFWSNDQQS